MQTDEQIKSALIAIGESVIATKSQFGGRPPNDNEKQKAGLRALRDRLCPHKHKINETFHAIGAQAAVTALDCTIAIMFHIEVPLLKISEMICLVGIDKFCASPEIIIRSSDDDSV